MKKLFLATVHTRTQQYHGGDDIDRTRIIPVYAEDIDEVDDMVRDLIDGDDIRGDRTSVLSIDVEKTIGSPD